MDMNRVSVRAVVDAMIVVGVVSVGAAWRTTSAQESFPTGQNVVPVFEGWEKNPDGSFNLVFGYFNRNWEEEVDVPVGSDNRIEPGPADQGQPTHFYPRRSRFLFRVRVPQDFGTREVVWSLTTHGKTERTYGTLKPDYFIDDIVIMNNSGAGGMGGGAFNIHGNKPPAVTVAGDKKREVKVGQPVLLTATATDDGMPKRRVNHSSLAAAVAAGAATAPSPASTYVPSRIGSRCCPDSSSGLRLAWFVYRGPAARVTFDPPQFDTWEDYRDGRNSPWSDGWEPPPVPEGGRWNVRVTFSEPGTYVLRAQAHDGGLAAAEDVTLIVTR